MLSLKHLLQATAITLLLSGCQATTEKDQASTQYSGFLKDYSLLGPTIAQDSFAVKRWISPELKSGEYGELKYVSTQFYPEAKVTDQASDQMLTEVLIYVDRRLRQASYLLTKELSQTGSKVARVRTAITAVETLAKDFENEEVVSQALIAAAEATAVNPHNDDAVIAFELEARDIVTGELLAQSVVTGVAPTYKIDGQEKVSLELLKPTIDHWIEFATSSAR